MHDVSQVDSIRNGDIVFLFRWALISSSENDRSLPGVLK
jgi:hypothetical protein